MKEIIVKLADIAKEDCGYSIYYMKDDQVKYTRSRKKEVVMIRACIMAILYRHYRYGVTSIGREFGVDHSTVIHHLGNHTTRMQYEEEYNDMYSILAIGSRDLHAFAFDIDDTLSKIRGVLNV